MGTTIIHHVLTVSAGWQTGTFYTQIMNKIKGLLPDLAMVVLFLAISFVYFFTPVSQGLVLDGHDTTAGVGMGLEQKEYRERTGETTRWTNSVFGGMPTYQIAPSYDSSRAVQVFGKIYGFGTSGVIACLFLYLWGFYILLRAFNFRPYLAALGAVLWAFSSYFLIIIAAGHIWKVFALAYLPPLIGGMILCYRGRLLWGGAVTALFTALEIQANHVQMTYYYLFAMGFIVLAYGIGAFVRRNGTDEFGVLLTPKTWLKATGVIIVAGLLGVLTNASNLYHTYQYSAETMRGGSELTQRPAKANPAAAASSATAGKKESGLERDYITQWSYGIGETMTLLIPDFKGGGSGSVMEREDVMDLPGFLTFQQTAGELQQALGQNAQQITIPGLNQYWGDQPFTVGPVYVGALVCFLFLLGLFLVKSPIKWALAAATLLSFLFAWGHNLWPTTNFFIDYLPMYNKFRTVSSALVIAEFTMPLMAILTLAEILRNPSRLDWKTAAKDDKIGLGVSLALTVGVCLLLWIAPGMAGDCLSVQEEQTLAALTQAGVPSTTLGMLTSSVNEMRHAILSHDALRSLIILLLGIAALYAYSRKAIAGWLLCAVLGVISIIDLWQIDKRYLNDSKFVDPVMQTTTLQTKTPADERLLADKSNYRVVDVTKDIFNDNTTATWHKSIGGYHPAKLRRYQDLIDRRLATEIMAFANAVQQAGGDMSRVNADSVAPTLNMLNMKYMLFGTEAEAVVENPAANGNGWFVRQLGFVENADAEMAALDHLDTKRAAVADKRFEAALQGSALDSGRVEQTQYAPNELHYTVESARGGVVVFSEIYYPGWTAKVDGQEVEVGRANYVLRAIKVPSGKHEVVMEFRPTSVKTTETIAYIASALILLLLGFALWRRAKATPDSANA